MKRLPAVVSSGVFVILVLLVAGYSMTRNKPSSAFSNRTQEPAHSNRTQEPAQVAAVPAAPIIPGLFVAPDLPVNVAAGAVNAGKVGEEIPCAINAKAQEKITRLHFVLFQFDQNRKLLAVDSWSSALDLTNSRTGNLGLRLRKPIIAGAIPVLSLEAVSGPDNSWDIDFPELAQTVVARVGGNQNASANVRRSMDENRVDYGSNYCARSFALSLNAARLSGGANPPFFTCNQHERNYSFAFLNTEAPAPK